VSDGKDSDTVVQLAKEHDEGKRLGENRLLKAGVAWPDGKLSRQFFNASNNRLTSSMKEPPSPAESDS
jgi:hypothetical protein